MCLKLGVYYLVIRVFGYLVIWVFEKVVVFFRDSRYSSMQLSETTPCRTCMNTIYGEILKYKKKCPGNHPRTNQ
jgi:hypothetical protein